MRGGQPAALTLTLTLTLTPNPDPNPNPIQGIAYTEYVMDLSDKPMWLVDVIGKPAGHSLTTPMMAYRGVWYTNSARLG